MPEEETFIDRSYRASGGDVGSLPPNGSLSSLGLSSLGKPERQAILEEATQLTMGDRNREYGEPKVNLAETATLWSTYLGHDVKAYQVSIMLALLKIARIKANPQHRDNYVDGVAYLAIAKEVL